MVFGKSVIWSSQTSDFSPKNLREAMLKPSTHRSQRASESLRELQRAAIDDTEKLMQSFNFSKNMLSSCKPFQTCHISHWVRKKRDSESFRELQRAAIDDIEQLIQNFNFSKHF